MAEIVGRIYLDPGTTNKARIVGPTPVEYATNLTDNDLTNKQYVDSAITGGTIVISADAIKSYQAIVSLNINGTTLIGTSIPANATILSVKVSVIVPDSTALLSVGSSVEGVAAFMTTTENDTQSVGIYKAETYYVVSTSQQVAATVTSSSGIGAGVCRVDFEFLIPPG